MFSQSQTYPTIASAKLDGIDLETARKVRGRLREADLAKVTEHEQAELADGHLPGIDLMEIVRADDSVYYEAVTAPNCSHLCEKCRTSIERDTNEFGEGAIGAFADSSGGEMERLRRELRQLAATMSSAVNSINARLPGDQHPELVPGRTSRKTLPPAGVVKIPMREMHHSQGIEKVEAIVTDPDVEDDDAQR